MPELSIVIVNWNAQEHLARCLRSLREHPAARQAEIIVVDNASNDGSPDLVVEQFPDVRLIRSTENLGFARGNNRGVAESTGSLVALVNSDIQVKRGALDALCAELDSDPSIGMAGPRVRNPDGSIQYSCRRFPSLWRTFCRALGIDSVFPGVPWLAGEAVADRSYDERHAVDVLSGCFWMVSRKALDAVGPLDESYFMYAEDIDWCRRFRDAGYAVVYTPAAEVIHYGGASSADAPLKYYLEQQKANIHYWRKTRGPGAVAAFKLLLALHQAVRIARGAALLAVRPGDRASTRFKIQRSAECLRALGKGTLG